MSFNGKKDWIDRVSDALKPIPIAGPLIAGIVIMTVGLVCWVAFVAFIGLILIPFQAARGIVKPDVQWGFPLDDAGYRNSRADGVVYLTFYIVMYGLLAYLLFF